LSALRHLFLVDGSGFIFRAFHALPPMTRGDGTPVNAVFGFTNMLMKLVSETDADAVAVIFDAARKTFRSDVYPAYKAHRPPPPEELVPQFPLIREATRAFDLPCIELEGFEADDIIATYARRAAAQGIKVTVVSSDKDLMQLVGDGIAMLDPIKNKPIGEAEVREKFGVAPDKVVHVQALCGDAADNVPGVPGIGVKTAAQLIEQFGDLESLLSRTAEIKQPKRREALEANAEAARISLKLVTLVDDVPLPEPLDSLAVRQPDPERLAAFLEQQGFRSILARVQAKQPPVAAAAPPPAVRDYELVLDVEALDRWLAAASLAGTVAIDTETTALDPLRCDLVGFSLAVEPGRACYVPLRHGRAEAQGMLALGGDTTPAGPALIPLDVALGRLQCLCGDPSVLKVGHNIKYDMQVLGGSGVSFQAIDDTMLMSYVLDGAAHGHGLDELAKLHFDHDTIKYADVCGSGKTQVTFDKVPLDKALDYAAEDADYTLRLHRLLRRRLLAEHMLTVYETLERPLVPVVVTMERHGIRVDSETLKSLSSEFGRRMVDLEDEIQRLAGHAFNVGSPPQLGRVLFEEMGLPGGKKTGKSGQWATGADVLEGLAAEGCAVAARVLDWRQIQKLKGTYADALVAQVNPRSGRVHTSYSLAATSTGRLASSDPNLQNIPIRTEEGRKIRRAFVAEPGNRILSADYSQIELRLVAHVAGIEGLKQAFRTGADIHAITASQVFGVPVEGIDPSLRRRAKAINFGIIYGISAFGLAQQLGISNGEAKAYIEAYFARYPEIRAYMERAKEEARSQGFVTTLFGRKVFTPGIKDRNAAMRGFAERAAINAPIQGGAADIIKRAMIRVPGELKRVGLSARMLLQVHDELVFEVPEAECDATRALVKRVMEGAASLDVPLVVDTGVAGNWEEAH
jgi:DNA polymerase-1